MTDRPKVSQLTCREPLATGLPGDRCDVCGWVVPEFRTPRRTPAAAARGEGDQT